MIYTKHKKFINTEYIKRISTRSRTIYGKTNGTLTPGGIVRGTVPTQTYSHMKQTDNG